MRRRIKKNVKFKTDVTSDDIAYYSEGTVIYDNEEIRFGKVIVYSPYNGFGGGYYLFDDKYIYECLTSGVITKIFDIDNRCVIDDRIEFLNMRKEIEEKKLRKKIKF